MRKSGRRSRRWVLKSVLLLLLLFIEHTMSCSTGVCRRPSGKHCRLIEILTMVWRTARIEIPTMIMVVIGGRCLRLFVITWRRWVMMMIGRRRTQTVVFTWIVAFSARVIFRMMMRRSITIQKCVKIYDLYKNRLVPGFYFLLYLW